MNQPFQAFSDSNLAGRETVRLIKPLVIKTCADRNTLSLHKLMLFLPFGSCKESSNPLTVKAVGENDFGLIKACLSLL